jgi:hypothetical protein
MNQNFTIQTQAENELNSIEITNPGISQPCENTAIYHQLPPVTAFLVALDQRRLIRKLNPAKSIFNSAIWEFVEGSLASSIASISLYMTQNNIHAEQGRFADLLILREFQANGRIKLLRERLRDTADIDDQLLPDFLNLQAGVYSDSRRSSNQNVERELLYRGQLHECWKFHRVRWEYRQLQNRFLGNVGNQLQAAKRARSAGIFFHPDQLRALSMNWVEIRRLLERFPVGSLFKLFSSIRSSAGLEINIAEGDWRMLRPLITDLLSGGGLHFFELPAYSWPCSLPESKDDLQQGVLVFHLAKDSKTMISRLRDHVLSLEARGWKVLILNSSNRQTDIELESIDLRLELDRKDSGANMTQDSVVPLREYLRRIEQQYIHDVLDLHAGIKTRACESLKITRQTLYAKLGRCEREQV